MLAKSLVPIWKTVVRDALGLPEIGTARFFVSQSNARARETYSAQVWMVYRNRPNKPIVISGLPLVGFITGLNLIRSSEPTRFSLTTPQPWSAFRESTTGLPSLAKCYPKEIDHEPFRLSTNTLLP
jgi:hypothetical protein